MFHESTPVLVALKLVTFALGLYLVYLGYKAYRKQRQRTVLWLTAGLLILTVGVGSEYAAFAGLNWSLQVSHFVEAVVGVIGFAVLVYSLHAKD